MSTTSQIDFTRINNDGNGNPRYVCHFLNFTTDNDTEQLKADHAASLDNFSTTLIGLKYDLAIARAKKIGGKKYHNKSYGGGIVFQSYNIASTEKDIHSLMAQYK